MALEKSDELISVEDYLAGELVSEIKHEYLGGVVHAMAGAKMRHNKVAMNLALTLGNSLQGSPCQPFNSDTKVKIQLPDQIRFYYPDLQVICEPVNDDATFIDCPVVLVEVLSESTKRIDEGEKRDTYLTIPSLQVLILVDPHKLHVKVDRRSPDGGFVQEIYRDLSETIDLPEIASTLSLSDIYRELAFDTANGSEKLN